MSIENRNLKPGQVLVARYKQREHRCEVVKGEEGKVRYRLKDGREFASPSAAGSAVMGGTACNGWRFWSLEGDLSAPKAAKTPRAARKAKTARKAATRAKRRPMAKRGSRAKGGAKSGAKPKEAGNPSPDGAGEPAPKPVTCGECGAEFPDGAAATEHMQTVHKPPEAAPGER